MNFLVTFSHTFQKFIFAVLNTVRGPSCTKQVFKLKLSPSLCFSQKQKTGTVDCLRQDLSIQPWLAWNSLQARLALGSQGSACFCFLSVGIKGVFYHTWLLYSSRFILMAWGFLEETNLTCQSETSSVGYRHGPGEEFYCQRHHDQSNSYKGHLIGAGLQFQRFSPLPSQQKAWQCASRHGTGRAESSTSCFEVSHKEVLHQGGARALGDLKGQVHTSSNKATPTSTRPHLLMVPLPMGQAY